MGEVGWEGVLVWVRVRWCMWSGMSLCLSKRVVDGWKRMGESGWKRMSERACDRKSECVRYVTMWESMGVGIVARDVSLFQRIRYNNTTIYHSSLLFSTFSFSFLSFASPVPRLPHTSNHLSSRGISSEHPPLHTIVSKNNEQRPSSCHNQSQNEDCYWYRKQY